VVIRASAVAAVGHDQSRRVCRRRHVSLADVAAALCVGIVLPHLVHSPSHGMGAVLTVPALVWLGRISYGVHLWYSPIQTSVLREARMLWLGFTGPLRVAIPFAVTIAVATASFYLLERPILRANAKRRERIGRRANVAPGPERVTS
jgi:peptidoglycan/LPS O-acetylase OafA/YrhL